jgi:hypothetical protein
MFREQPIVFLVANALDEREPLCGVIPIHGCFLLSSFFVLFLKVKRPSALAEPLPTV